MKLTKEQMIWESIMRTAISKRDTYYVGTAGWESENEAIEELQKVFLEKFGKKFTYGIYSD